jgi:hypothetical protein
MYAMVAQIGVNFDPSGLEGLVFRCLFLLATLTVQFAGGIVWLAWIARRGEYSLREFMLLTAYWALWLVGIMRL